MEVMFMQVFEHLDSVEAQMRQQVASSSDSLACTFLAAGSRAPPWLFAHPASAIGAQGNTLRKQYLDLANLKREGVVHLAPPTSHQMSEPKLLEFGGVKPGSCNITVFSETINHCKNRMSETTLTKFPSLHVLNEDLSSTISLEASLHEALHSVSSPLPEKETTHSAESYSLEGHTSGAPELLGSPQRNILDDDRGRSLHPNKNILEDGCRHDSHPHVCGAFNTCSSQSAANLEKLLHESGNDEHLYQNNILFPGTINHNDSCSASASDAFLSAQIEPFQTQTSLPKLSPEFDRTATTVDTHIESSSLFTSNKSLQIEPVLDSVSCHIKTSGDAESKHLVRGEAYDVSVRNNMEECVTPAVMGGASSEGAQILQTAERNTTTSAKEYLGRLWHEELNASSSSTVYDKQIQSSQTSAQHLPCSSGSGKMAASFKADVQSTVSQRNRSIADGVQTQVNSSCETVAMNCQSSSNVSLAPQYSQLHYLENDPEVSNSLPNYYNTLSDGDACCISKKNSCFAYPDTDVKAATVEEKILTGIDCVACGSGVLNTENYPMTPTTSPRFALYQKNQHASLEYDEKGIDGGQQVSNSAIPWQSVDIYDDYDETVQQCQSFSIPVPSKTKSSTIKERVFVGLSESTKLFGLSSSLSTKYKMGSKMKPLCGVYESLAARLEKLANQCSINAVDTNWHNSDYDIKNLRLPGKYGSDFDDPLLMSNVLTHDSANAKSVQEDNIPLTPSVEKYSLEKLSGRTGFKSECMGSIPELACFQIHGDSKIAEEDENEETLPGCPGINYSSQDLTGRKPLDHITSLYQRREMSPSLSTRYVDVGRLGLTTSKACNMDPDPHLNIRTGQATKNSKENCASSIRKGKVSQPLCDGVSRAVLLNRKNARHRSEANLGKGWKRSNSVTNMTPFVPPVKQNQQPRTSCVKEDIRVKALVAAEAAKRCQEKKQNERNVGKAAAVLERERLKQAREQKQKQIERKNKIDTRKRQREYGENKENGIKKKCTKAAQIPEQQVDRLHATHSMQDGCLKNYDDKEPRRNSVRGLKNEIVSGERTEYVQIFIAPESNDLKAVVAGVRSENISDAVDKSYDMSPCKDSDEEDNDDLEHQEEIRRRRKFIPSWSREENLDKILLSNQSLDPAEIFARNGCFSLSDVLPLHVPQRLLG